MASPSPSPSSSPSTKGSKSKSKDYDAVFERLSQHLSPDKSLQLEKLEAGRIRRIKELEEHYLEQTNQKYSNLKERRSLAYRSEKEISKYKRDYAVAKQRLWEARMQLLENMYNYNMGSHTVPITLESSSSTGIGFELEVEERVKVARPEPQPPELSLEDMLATAPAARMGAAPMQMPKSNALTNPMSRTRQARAGETAEVSASLQGSATTASGKDRERYTPVGAREREGGSNSKQKKRRHFGKSIARGGFKVTASALAFAKWGILTSCQLVEDLFVCSDYLVSRCSGAAKGVIGKVATAFRPMKVGKQKEDLSSQSGTGATRRDRERSRSTKDGTMKRRKGMNGLMKAACYALGMGFVYYLNDKLPATRNKIEDKFRVEDKSEALLPKTRSKKAYTTSSKPYVFSGSAILLTTEKRS